MSSRGAMSLPSPSSAVGRPFEEEVSKRIEKERFENLERPFFFKSRKGNNEWIYNEHIYIYIYKEIACFFHVYPRGKEGDLNGTVLCERERLEAI